jgi:hypothetical protein
MFEPQKCELELLKPIFLGGSAVNEMGTALHVTNAY